MALITLDTTVAPTIELWETNPDPGSPLPRAKVVFRSDITVALLGAGDTLLATGSFVLPPNFAYLPVDLRAQLDTVSPAEAALFEDALGFHYEVDGFETHSGVLVNQVIGSGATPLAVAVRSPAVTLDFSTYFTPQPGDNFFREVAGGFIFTNGAASWTFETRFLNNTGDAAAAQLDQEYTFLQFTVEQARRSLVHLYGALFT